MPGWLKRTVLVLLVLLLASQLYRPARTNPPSDPSARLHAKVEVPADASALFDRACADCHSNETRWPWYSHVAPMMWGVAYDVREGRAHWNMSSWSFSSEEGADLLDEMCSEVKERHMPLPRYLWFHPDARLTNDDVRRLCAWTERAADQLLASH